MTEWFDTQFDEDRKELADLEYSDPLVPVDDEEEVIEIEICTCEISDFPCPMHPVSVEEDE